ncbi:MAG: acetoacetate decarboxylase family protein [Acidimicrobiales bacterium]
MPTIRYGARPVADRTDREVAATKLGAWSTSLTATFATDPAVIAAVLPPPLAPAHEPTVKVGVSRVDLGGTYPPFGAGTVAVAARHGDLEVVPAADADDHRAGCHRRAETFGEPKKLAQISLDVDEAAGTVAATVARMGATIIELGGTLGAELDPPPAGDRVDFYLKFLRSPSGVGFDDDPWLVHCHRETETRAHRAVDGSLVLGESRFDPVADIPIVGGLAITLSERRSSQWGELVARLPAADIEPYAHQRYDDLSPAGKD